MTITTVISTYNRQHVIGDCIKAILEAEKVPDEILIINDGGYFSKGQMPYESHSKVQWLNLAQNVGVPLARNIGVLLADGDLVWWLDDDAIPEPGTLSELFTAIMGLNDVAAVGGPVWENPEPMELLVSKPMLVSVFGQVLDLATFKIIGDKRHLEADHLRGGNMLFRKALFYEVGMLDLDYCDKDGRSFRDETDLCLKWKEKGYRMIYVPEARVQHRREKRGGVWEKFNKDNHFLAAAEKIFHERWSPKRYLSKESIPNPPWVRIYEVPDGE